VFALYMNTKHFHWHIVGSALSRLSPSAGRARRSDFRNH
jgi:hypothetical protein